MDSYSRIRLFSLMPVFCLAVPVLFYGLVWGWRQWRSGVDKFNFKSVLSSTIVLWFLVYTGVCREMMGVFVCKDLGGGVSVLRSDVSVDCSGEEYRGILGLAVLVLVLYGAGLPVVVMLILRAKREAGDARLGRVQRCAAAALVKHGAQRKGVLQRVSAQLGWSANHFGPSPHCVDAAEPQVPRRTPRLHRGGCGHCRRDGPQPETAQLEALRRRLAEHPDQLPLAPLPPEL